MKDLELQGYLTSNGRIKSGYAKSLLDKLRSIDKLRCCRCKKILDKDKFSEFHYSKAFPYCITCNRISRSNSERKATLRDKYNLCTKDYEMMLAKQKNVCAICKNSEDHVNHYTRSKISLTIDHCHTTGKIRGLLCRNCNLMLGNSKDSVITLKAAIKYLTKTI